MARKYPGWLAGQWGEDMVVEGAIEGYKSILACREGESLRGAARLGILRGIVEQVRRVYGRYKPKFNEGIELGDPTVCMIADPRPLADQVLLEKERMLALSQTLKRVVRQKARIMILLYLYRNMTLREIGERFEVSESNVSLVIKKNVGFIKRHMKGR